MLQTALFAEHAVPASIAGKKAARGYGLPACDFSCQVVRASYIATRGGQATAAELKTHAFVACILKGGAKQLFSCNSLFSFWELGVLLRRRYETSTTQHRQKNMCWDTALLLPSAQINLRNQPNPPSFRRCIYFCYCSSPLLTYHTIIMKPGSREIELGYD